MKAFILIIQAILAAAILTGCDASSSAKNDALERERQELAAEGKAITDAMEKANREHDFSHVTEIKARQAEFYRRSAEYMAKRAK